MVLAHHNTNAARHFRRMLNAIGVDTIYRRLGEPVKTGATYTKTVIETATPKALRGSQETVEAVLGAEATKEVQQEPWEIATEDVVGPVSPQDELEVGGTIYEVLAAQRDTLAIRWILATRVKAL